MYSDIQGRRRKEEGRHVRPHFQNEMGTSLLCPHFRKITCSIFAICSNLNLQISKMFYMRMGGTLSFFVQVCEIFVPKMKQ